MWDSLAPVWQACLEEAWLAYCAGSVPIGAAVADAHGQVIVASNNRALAPRASTWASASARSPRGNAIRYGME